MIHLKKQNLILTKKGDLFRHIDNNLNIVNPPVLDYLSHFQDENGDDYLLKRILDRDLYNIWVVIKTNKILEYLEKEITLVDLMRLSEKLIIIKLIDKSDTNYTHYTHFERNDNLIVDSERVISFNKLGKNYYSPLDDYHDYRTQCNYCESLYRNLVNKQKLKLVKEASVGNFVKIMITASVIALILLFVCSLLT